MTGNDEVYVVDENAEVPDPGIAAVSGVRSLGGARGGGVGAGRDGVRAEGLNDIPMINEDGARKTSKGEGGIENHHLKTALIITRDEATKVAHITVHMSTY